MGILRVALALVLLVGALSLSGCAKEPELPGTWASEDRSFIAVFRDDGTIVPKTGNQTVMRSMTHWSLEGSRLKLTGPLATITFEAEIKGDSLILTDSEGVSEGDSVTLYRLK